MAEKKKQGEEQVDSADAESKNELATTAEETAAQEAAPAEAEPAEAEEVAAEEPVTEVVAAAEQPPAEVAEEQTEAPVGTEAAEPAAAEPRVSASAPAEAQGPKPKRKRLPRALRSPRTKTAVAKPATRKPIVRLEKPEHDRGRRQERQGKVVSSAMDKTIVVKVDVLKAHPKYKKVVRRSTKFHAHDEANQANVGDIVRIVETRPLSKTKRWRLAEIVEAAK